jgi:hypothetical protein
MASLLESSGAGRVLRPGESWYAEALAVFNPDVHHTPELVVEAASAADVVAAMRYGADRALPVHVLSAGHAPAPPIRSGVVVTLRRMDSVAVDGPRRIATLGGGARAGAVVAAAAPLGLAPVTGSNSTDLSALAERVFAPSAAARATHASTPETRRKVPATTAIENELPQSLRT